MGSAKMTTVREVPRVRSHGSGGGAHGGITIPTNEIPLEGNAASFAAASPRRVTCMAQFIGGSSAARRVSVVDSIESAVASRAPLARSSTVELEAPRWRPTSVRRPRAGDDVLVSAHSPDGTKVALST
jgi:hypothetical protein